MSWLVYKGRSSQGVPNYYHYGLQMCDPPPPAGPRTYQLLMALEPQQEDQGHCRGMTAVRQEQTGCQVSPQSHPRHCKEQEF